MKNKNGITLIALIITIVVLIILAGVAVNLSLGENGLFKKAKIATEEYTNAQRTEETEIAKITNEIDNYSVDNSNRDISEIIGEFNPIIILNDGTTLEVTSNAKDVTNGEIVGYAYMANGKVLDFKNSENGTINGLQHGNDYIITVIAMDEYGKIKKSNDLNVKMSSKKYLYNYGDERIAITNGWIPVSADGTNVTMTRNQDNLYAKNNSTAGTGYSNYHASWITKNKINLTNYSKIVCKGEFKAPNNTRMSVFLVDDKGYSGAMAGTGGYCQTITNETKNEIIVNIPSQYKNGSYNIMVDACNSNGNSHSEFTLNSVYLEE